MLLKNTNCVIKNVVISSRVYGYYTFVVKELTVIYAVQQKYILLQYDDTRKAKQYSVFINWDV